MRCFSSPGVCGPRSMSTARTRQIGLGELERVVDEMPVLGGAAPGPAREPHPPLPGEPLQRLPDLRLVVLDDRVPARRLVAGKTKRVERERIGVRRRPLLLDQAAEDTDLNGVGVHARTIVSAHAGDRRPCKRRPRGARAPERARARARPGRACSSTSASPASTSATSTSGAAGTARRRRSSPGSRGWAGSREPPASSTSASASPGTTRPAATPSRSSFRTRRRCPFPNGLSDELACAALLQGMTAHYLATSTYPIQPGDEVPRPRRRGRRRASAGADCEVARRRTSPPRPPAARRRSSRRAPGRTR